MMGVLFKLFTLCSLLVVCMPVRANDFHHLNGFQQNEAYAGAYLTFKFGSNARQSSKNNFKYGLSAGVRQQSFDFYGTTPINTHNNMYNFQANSLFEHSKIRQVRIFDTTFDGDGFKKINFANIPVYQRNQYGELEFIKFGFDGGDDDGASPWRIIKWIAIVGGIAVVTIAAVLASY